MLIHVTAEDIAQGGRYSHDQCPVALALQRAANGQPFRVNAARIERPDGGRIFAPERVWLFVDAFDSERYVEPFAFEVPDDFLTATRGA